MELNIIAISKYLLSLIIIMLIYSASWGLIEDKVKKLKYWQIIIGIFFGVISAFVGLLTSFLSVEAWLIAPVFIALIVAKFISPISAYTMVMTHSIIVYFNNDVNLVPFLAILAMKLMLVSAIFTLREISLFKRRTNYIIGTMIAIVIGLFKYFKYEQNAGGPVYLMILSITIPPIVMYLSAALIKRIYDHSMILKQTTEYETGSSQITRPAFAKEALKNFVIDNDVNHGLLVAISLSGLMRINQDYGTKIGDQYVNMVINSLKASLIQTKHKILKLTNDNYGFFIKLEDQNGYINILDSLDGNDRVSRKECDQIKLVEDVLLEIPKEFEFQGQKVKVQPRAGVAIYGAQSCDFDELIEYTSYTLNTKTWVGNGNIAQVYNTNAHRQFIMDKKQLAFLDDITDRTSLNTKFAPIVDLDRAEIFAYKPVLVTDDENYFDIDEIVNEAKNQGLDVLLEKVTATIAKNTFKTFKDFSSKKLVLEFPSEAFIDEYYNEVNLLKRLVIVGYNPENIIFSLKLTSEIVEHQKFIKTINFLKKAKASIMIRGLEKTDFNPEWLEIVNPDFACLDLDKVGSWQKDTEVKQLVASYQELCEKLDIDLVVDGLRNIKQVELAHAIGIRYAAGHAIAQPSYKEPKFRYGIRTYLGIEESEEL